MLVRLLPWQPEYGAAMQFDDDPAEDGGLADLRVEREVWAPVTPRVEASPLRIVDGVRRVEAHALETGDDGETRLGLFGSVAVGAVTVAPGRAEIIEDSVRVDHCYLHTGPEGGDRLLEAGKARLTFRALARSEATNAVDLINGLTAEMRHHESRLAERLSEDASVLTLVDGPLRSLRSPGPRVVGYVKRLHQLYVGREALPVVEQLDVGERSPLFTITAAAGDGYASDRYSWFVRLAHLGGLMHPLGGVMRLEASAGISLEEARVLADQTAAALPRLASSPARDPRAPHNLTPVGALEARLTHLLGDRRLIYRLLAASVSRDAARWAS